MKTNIVSETEAAAAGFATFNRCQHLCVDIPDGMSTITCRTSQGRLVTFCFVPYENDGPPQCVDIHEKTGPKIDLDDSECHVQRIIAFGKGRNVFRSNFNAQERQDAVTLTCLVISPP